MKNDTPPVIVADNSPTTAEVRPPGSHQNPKKVVQKGYPGGPEKLVKEVPKTQPENIPAGPTVEDIPEDLPGVTPGKEDAPLVLNIDKSVKLSLVGSDVIALYPSLTADRTAAIVRRKIEESEIKFEGFNYDMGRAYLAINLNEMNAEQVDKLKSFIPQTMVQDLQWPV